MKNCLLNTCLFFVAILSQVILTSAATPGHVKISGAKTVHYSKETAVPVFCSFSPGSEPFFREYQNQFLSTFHFSSGNALKWLRSDTDQMGMIHYRYVQTYQGISIENTMYIFHVRHGKLISMNGLLYQNFKASPVISIDDRIALNKAMAYFPSEKYIWQDSVSEAHLKMQFGNQDLSYKPRPELVFAAPDNDLNPAHYSLTYKLDIYSMQPLFRKFVYIQVHDGSLILTRDRIHTSDTVVTAITALAGTKRITADMVSANSFRLRETKRGNGIETYNMRKGTSYAAAVDFTDTDTTWNNVNANLDQYATDAHFGSEMTYDFYKKKFNRNSIDNAGFKLLSYIHYSSNYVNAFWDGTKMTYGDGNATYKPLVAIDIAGHEITHGLTTFTANLNYSYESGALNESFSDVLGTAIEWYGDSARFEWDLGKKIGVAIRSMSNPKAFSQPDTYKGVNWYVGAADNGGVHTNSGVQNYWFYILCMGDTGTNDLGNKYAVDSIGMEKAAAIAYRTLTFYLTTTSQYADARTYSIQAAADLFGACSFEQVAVAKAWYAVGIGAQYNDIQFAQPNASIVTKGSANNDIFRVMVTPACTGTAADTLKYIKFTNAGSTRKGIITKASLYYTGNSATFSTATLVGSVTNPSDTFVITGNRVLASNENYFWLAYDVSSNANIGDSLDAVCLEVQTDSNTSFNGVVAGLRKVGLCIPPTSTNACVYMYTSKVVLDSISNTSACSSTSYADFTSKSTTVHPGDTMKYAVTFTSYNQYLTIWIDANNDGIYSPSEKVISNQLSTGFLSSGQFVVPPGISLGNHVIRVKADYNQITGDSNGCGQLTYGETEDYLLKVVKSADMTYTAAIISQNKLNVSRNSIHNQIIGLKIVTANSANPLILRKLTASARGCSDSNEVRNMKLWYTGSSALFVPTKSFGSVATAPGMAAFTFIDSLSLLRGNNYLWLTLDVDSNAVIGDSIDAAVLSFAFDSATYTPDTTDPAGKRRIDYCNPIGGANNNYNASGYEFGIKRVMLNTISNTTGVPTTAGTFYNSYTNITTILNAGSNYTLSITPGSSAATYSQASIGWVDWNNDGRFDTTEEIGRNFSHTGVVSFTVKVNASQKPGKFRMRLMSGYGYYYNTGAMTFDPCYIRNPSANYDISECEDYTLDVYPAVPNPSITPNSTVNICLGDTVFFATGLDTSYSYKWYSDTTLIFSGKGSAADSLIFVPASFGTYKIKVKTTDSYAQSGTSAQINVIVNAPAAAGTISVSADSICKSAKVTLITNNYNGTLNWQQNIGSGWTNTGQSNDTVSFNPIGQISFRVIASSGVCKNDTSTQKVIYIKASPLKGNLIASGNAICAGNSVLLSVNNYQGSITWVSGSGSSWGAIPGVSDTLTVTPSSNASYRAVSATATCGTDTSNIVSVTVSQPSQSGSISASASAVCSGKNLTLILSGRVGAVQWQSNSGSGWSNLAITKDTAVLNPTVGTDYRVIVTSGVCNADTSAKVSVTVNPNPIRAQLKASKSVVCQGDSVMLYATGYVGNIQWQVNSGNGFQNIQGTSDSIMVIPSQGFLYRALSVSNTCGTDTSLSLQIQVNPLPAAGTVVASSQTLCYGDTASLYTTGASGQIQWFIYNGTSWSNTGTTGSNIKSKIYNSASYRAVAWTATCGSDSSSAVSIYVKPQIIAGTVSASRVNVCSGDTVNLSLTGNGGQVQWWMNDGNGWSQLQDTINAIVVRPTVTTQYRVVSVVAGCGADTANTVDIKIIPGPKGGNIGINLNKICEGDSANLNLSNYSGVILWEAGSAGAWNQMNGSSSSIRVAPNPGVWNYRARVSNTCGYIYSDTVTLNVDERPVATNVILSDTGVCYGAGVTLSMASGYKGNISWEYQSGSNWNILGPTGSPANYTPMSNMTFRATLSNGVCPAASTSGASVQVYPIPNAITNPAGTIELCKGDSVQLKAVNPAVKTEWFQNNVLLNTGLSAFWVMVAGDYQLVQTNSYGCKDSSAVVRLQVNPLPDTPVISLDQKIKNRLVSSAAYGNQWYLNGQALTGANGTTLDPLQSGDYSVMVTDSNGCRSVFSDKFVFWFAGISDVQTGEIGMRLFPNPCTYGHNLGVALQGFSEMPWITVSDMAGKEVIHGQPQKMISEFDISGLLPGQYLIKAVGPEGMVCKNVLIFK